ncbi:MAG: adenylosuccinate synthase [Gemmatimonadetes bacterium]|nr:adenylosuccinate synthase [Gemmatimonadota bacterium]
MAKGLCRVIVGAQWGDEGKGKIVDVLAREADIIARYQGGANAGHTVVVGDEQFVLHQVPSGILHPGKFCLLGNGVVLDPTRFFEEVDELERRGIDATQRLKVSNRAHLLLSYHRVLDEAKEGRRSRGRIGTTGRGIGPAYEDKAARSGIRVADLWDEQRLGEMVRDNVEEKNRWLEVLGSSLRVRCEDVLAEVLGYRQRLLAMSGDVSRAIYAALSRGERVLLEGAQGSLLDLDHGTYPYVTSSSTTAGGAATGVGIGPRTLDEIIGVVKAYTTRVGNGPLPTELPDEMGERLREAGGEYGATTGRPRRCGWFDAVVVRFAARVNGLTELAVTKLDVLDGLPSLRICVGYRFRGDRASQSSGSGMVGGERLQEFPGSLSVLENCEPIYEQMEGWDTPTAGARRIGDLPAAARRYLERIEELVRCPIRRVSVGTKRDQMVVLEAAPSDSG